MPTSVPKRTHGITWTLFDYNETDIENLKAYAKDECDYMVFGFEICPTTAKKHLQGYHHYKSARTYPNKAWRAVTQIEVRGRDFISRGNPQQNYDYCSKLGDFWQYGEIPKQGERTDWHAAVNHLQQGTPIATVVAEQPQLLPCVRALERFQTIQLQPKHRDVEVYILIGESGSGKTRWAYDNYPDLYSKPSGPWWDGYTGQKAILLDDYYGDIPYDQLLRVLDRYPLSLPIKGGFIYAQYTTVIITSNDPIDDWYPCRRSNMPALRRRITNLVEEYNHASKVKDESHQDEVQAQASI